VTAVLPLLLERLLPTRPSEVTLPALDEGRFSGVDFGKSSRGLLLRSEATGADPTAVRGDSREGLGETAGEAAGDRC